MNSRQADLYVLFASDPLSWRTSEQLGRVCGRCEKTMRTDIACINAWLERSGMDGRILGERGRGFRLVQDSGEAQRALRQLAVSAPVNEPHIELFIHGMIELLLTGHRHTIASLAATLFTSSSVLKHELARWESMLATYHVRLVRGRYLSVVGPELNIRAFFINYLFLLAPESARGDVAERLLGANRTAIDEALELLTPPGTHSSANARDQLRLYLAIAAARTRLGNSIDSERVARGSGNSNPAGASLARKSEEPASNANHTDGTDARATPQTRAGDESARIVRAQALLGESLNDAECRFLLQSDRYLADQWTPVLAASFRPQHPRTQMLVQSLLGALACEGIHVTHPLDVYLASIVDTAVSRMNEQTPTIDLDGNVIKTHCLNEHILLMRTVLDTPLWRETQLYPDDYTRITMLLAPLLERPARPPLPRAALVINAGVAVTMYVKTQIERAFSHLLTIDRIISETEVPGEANRTEHPGAAPSDFDVDFYITLGFLQTDTPYVHISSAVSQADLDAISRFLAEHRERRYRLLTPYTDNAPERLAAKTQMDVVRALYVRSACNGQWSGDEARYERALSTCCLVRDKRFIAVISSQDVPETGMLDCMLGRLLFFKGSEVERVSVLHLSPADDLTERFSALYRFKQHVGLPL